MWRHVGGARLAQVQLSVCSLNYCCLAIIMLSLAWNERWLMCPNFSQQQSFFWIIFFLNWKAFCFPRSFTRRFYIKALFCLLKESVRILIIICTVNWWSAQFSLQIRSKQIKNIVITSQIGRSVRYLTKQLSNIKAFINKQGIFLSWTDLPHPIEQKCKSQGNVGCRWSRLLIYIKCGVAEHYGTRKKEFSASSIEHRPGDGRTKVSATSHL